MNINELYKPIQQEMADVEKYLLYLLHTEDISISQSIPQILSAGGKRLRPALLLMASKICHSTGSRCVRLATAIELIHTASLIHDDIIDNDNLRRGLPTLNSRLGDTMCVILGDYLYSMVFTILAEENDMKIIRQVAATTSQMARGDLRQMQQQYNMELTEEHYLTINAEKTASLMSCACRIGALCGSGNNGEVETLSRYGQNLGMAFQIIDDLLDLTAEQKALGKPLGSDIRQGKLTLPLIHVLRQADEKEKQWVGSLINSRKIDPPDLNRVREMVTHYKSIEYCLDKAQHYSVVCKQELKSLEESEASRALIRFADFVVDRES